MKSQKNELKNNKTIELLKTLPKNKLKDFEKFLKSPWCNSKKKLVPLFKELKSFYPKFEHLNFNKAELSQKIFKTPKPYQLNNHLTFLYQALEKYFRYIQYEQDESLKSQTLINYYLSSNQSGKATKLINNKIKKLENKKTKDLINYLELSNLYDKLLNINENGLRFIANPPELEKYELYLDTYYSLKTLSYLLDRKQRKGRFNEDYEISSKKTSYFKNLIVDQQTVAINLYLERLEKDINDFQQLNNNFFKNTQNLNDFDCQGLLIYLINDAIKLRINGEPNMERKLHELYKFGVENNILVNNGKITEVTFYNLISMSNLCQETDYSNNFIEKYEDYIPSRVKKDALAWANAHIAFHAEDYNKCFDILSNKKKFKNFIFNSESKILQTQVYFEIFTRDKSFKKFLLALINRNKIWFQKNNRIKRSRVKSYTRFFNYLEKITNLLDTEDHFKFNKMLIEIRSEEKLILRSWLIENIEKILVSDPKERPPTNFKIYPPATSSVTTVSP